MDDINILSILGIFILRVMNSGLSTVRLIVMMYGRRRLAFFLAFWESLSFAVTAGMVLTDLSDLPNLITYALGFAVGGYVGMLIEERFVTGYMTLNIIAPTEGHEIAQALRADNFGVTETVGEGVRGSVTMLRCVVERKQVSAALKIAQAVNPDAFITVEEARAVQRGWLNARRSQRS